MCREKSLEILVEIKAMGKKMSMIFAVDRRSACSFVVGFNWFVRVFMIQLYIVHQRIVITRMIRMQEFVYFTFILKPRGWIMFRKHDIVFFIKHKHTKLLDSNGHYGQAT